MTPFTRQLNEGKTQTPAPRARSQRNASRQASELQRLRILSAMARIVCEHGVRSATVARVVGTAGVSRVTFYDLFADRDDCLHAVLETAVALASERASAAYASETGWAERVRAGLRALLEFFDEEPELARLCVVQAMAAGPETLARRVEVLDQLAGVVEQGRPASRSVAEPPLLTAEGVVGGTLGVIHARLIREDQGPLVDLLNPLMGMIVLPYLGAATALKEASQPPPARVVARGKRPIVRDPLEGLSIRLTYRTVRVIAAVAAQPGLSNREIGQHADIADDGQISKLLARLARLGLMENTGEGQAKGGANAWQLTQRGAELGRAIGRDSVGLDR
jgi:AcrR family transcriptional regulator